MTNTDDQGAVEQWAKSIQDPNVPPMPNPPMEQLARAVLSHTQRAEKAEGELNRQISTIAKQLIHFGIEPWQDGRSILDNKRPVDQHIAMIISSLIAKRDKVEAERDKWEKAFHGLNAHTEDLNTLAAVEAERDKALAGCAGMMNLIKKELDRYQSMEHLEISKQLGITEEMNFAVALLNNLWTNVSCDNPGASLLAELNKLRRWYDEIVAEIGTDCLLAEVKTLRERVIELEDAYDLREMDNRAEIEALREKVAEIYDPKSERNLKMFSDIKVLEESLDLKQKLTEQSAEIERLRGVVDAAQKFITKFNHPEIQSQIEGSQTMAFIHGFKYSGLNYGEEKKALELALEGMPQP